MTTTAVFRNINMMSKSQYNEIGTPVDGELYAISSSGVGKPSSKYVDLTLGSTGATYTAPGDGWVYINKVAGTANAYVSLQNNSTAALGVTHHVPGTGNTCRGFLPAKKGDVIAVSYNATGTTNTFRFIYDEGEH